MQFVFSVCAHDPNYIALSDCGWTFPGFVVLGATDGSSGLRIVDMLVLE